MSDPVEAMTTLAIWYAFGALLVFVGGSFYLYATRKKAFRDYTDSFFFVAAIFFWPVMIPIVLIDKWVAFLCDR